MKTLLLSITLLSGSYSYSMDTTKLSSCNMQISYAECGGMCATPAGIEVWDWTDCHSDSSEFYIYLQDIEHAPDSGYRDTFYTQPLGVWYTSYDLHFSIKGTYVHLVEINGSDTCVCIDSGYTIYMDVTDIDLPSISLNPNPVHSYLNIQLETDIVEFMIYDQIGRFMMRGLIEKDDMINVEELPSGLYTIILVGDQSGFGRFLKQ